MLITTTDNIPGEEYEIIGLATGCNILSKNFVRDIGSGLRNMVGGQMKAYTEMLDESQKMATDLLIEDAKNKGADAIVGVRFTTSSITQGGAEIFAYGTAVKIKK